MSCFRSTLAKRSGAVNVGRIVRCGAGSEDPPYVRLSDYTKRLPLSREPRLEACRAVAVTAGPRLRPVLVTTPAAGVRVLDADEIEVLLPVWAFLLKRRGAEAGLHPLHAPVGQLPGAAHVVLVFIAGHGPGAERALVDRAIERGALSGFDLCGDQIPHLNPLAHGARRSRTHLPSPCFTYCRRSCRRWVRPCQNSNVWGARRNPPHQSGRGTSLSANRAAAAA